MVFERTANKEIIRAHKQAFRIPLKDHNDSFDELLVRNDEKAVCTQNLQKLIIKITKSLNYSLFRRKEIDYNLRMKYILTLPRALTVCFGTIR